MSIRGKVVHFRVMKINDLYVLSDANIKPYKIMGYEPVSWLVDKLCPSRDISWATMKIEISIQDFTAQAQILLFIAKFLRALI